MIDPTRICIICGSRDFKALYRVTDTNENVAGEWDIIACASCGNGVLSPFPSNKEIESFYHGTFYDDDGKRFRGWMEMLRSMLGRMRGRVINRMFPARGRLLDYGSGAGHFADAQEKAGWEAHSVDPYSSASKNSDKCRLTEESFELLYPDNYFDVVTTWYVIEHLRNPDAAIAEFTRVLKPGGILLLAQQDFGSLQARFFGANWLYLDPPRHLWQFTAESLTMLAEKHGLKLAESNWASLEMSPFCMLQSALNMLLGNYNDLFRFLKNRKLSGGGTRRWAVIASIALLPILAPLIMLAYFGLLAINSGDVVSLYFRKK